MPGHIAALLHSPCCCSFFSSSFSSCSFACSVFHAFFHGGTLLFYSVLFLFRICTCTRTRTHIFYGGSYIWNGMPYCCERNHAHIINDASTRIVIITTIYLFGIQKILIFNISFLCANANRRHQPGRMFDERVFSIRTSGGLSCKIWSGRFHASEMCLRTYFSPQVIRYQEIPSKCPISVEPIIFRSRFPEMLIRHWFVHMEKTDRQRERRRAVVLCKGNTEREVSAVPERLSGNSNNNNNAPRQKNK